MVPVDITARNGHASNGHHNGHNGTNGVTASRDHRRHNPYAPRAADFLNNISNFKIIESTLRGPSHYFFLFSPYHFFLVSPCYSVKPKVR